MIQPDSIKILSDSALRVSIDSLARMDSVTRVDSIFRADSIARVDSILLADSLKHAEFINRGFDGMHIPIVPQIDNWLFGLLLFLFILLAFSVYHSSGLIAETIKNFFLVKERSSIFSKTTINDYGFKYVLLGVSAAAISLYVYRWFFNEFESFSVEKYTYLFLITITFLFFKLLVFDLIGYVFIQHKSINLAKHNYFSVISLLGISMYPIIVLQLYSPNFPFYTSEVFVLIICLVCALLIIIKLFQIFFQKLVASFYILLYLCTLEILPLIGLLQLYSLIV